MSVVARDLEMLARGTSREVLPQIHSNLVAKLAAIRPPRTPLELDPEDLEDIAEYEAKVLEAVKAHFGEVARHAGMNGVGNLDRVIGMADALFHEIASDLSGAMNSAAADLRGEP